MIKRVIDNICHVSDEHIPASDKRHPEFRIVFENMRLALLAEKPDLIVSTGDLFHDKLKITNECMLLAAEFLHMLSSIAPVVITRGNHDFASTVKIDKIDCVQALTDLVDFPRVTYLNKSGFWVYENIIFVVWHHGDDYSPWNQLELPIDEREESFKYQEIQVLLDKFGSIDALKVEGYTFIDLFHDPIRGCTTDAGFIMDSENYLPLDNFAGDFGFFGDIHQRHVWSTDKQQLSE